MPWLVSQGYQVVGSQQDTSVYPAITTYNLTKTAQSPQLALIELQLAAANAYNEARQKNSTRYDAIVANWEMTANSTGTMLDSAGSNLNGYIVLYMNDLYAMVAAVESKLDDMTQGVTDVFGIVQGQLTTFLTDLATLGNSYPGHASDIQSILATEQGDLTAFVSSYGTRLTALEESWRRFCQTSRHLTRRPTPTWPHTLPSTRLS